MRNQVSLGRSDHPHANYLNLHRYPQRLLFIILYKPKLPSFLLSQILVGYRVPGAALILIGCVFGAALRAQDHSFAAAAILRPGPQTLTARVTCPCESQPGVFNLAGQFIGFGSGTAKAGTEVAEDKTH